MKGKLGKHRVLVIGLVVLAAAGVYLWYRRRNAANAAVGAATMPDQGVINATAGQPSTTYASGNALDESVLSQLTNDLGSLAQSLVSYEQTNAQALAAIQAKGGASAGAPGPPGPPGPPGAPAPPAKPKSGLAPSSPAWGPTVFRNAVHAIHSGVPVSPIMLTK